MAQLLTPLLIVLLLTLSAQAQTQTTGSVAGSVVDAQRKPAAFAALKLLRAADSTLVTGTVANEAGQFTLANVPAGMYRVQASLVGTLGVTSAPVTIKAGEPTYLEPLMLRADEQTLAAVTVRARKPYIDQQTDKTVLNVAANDAVQSRTAYELLQQAPGVVIDPNDNIRMAGTQGVQVFIDGKPTNLSAADVANLLRATPASNIATVELIQNPSAKFDAQGGAGIINIRFRRDKSLGLNGNASGSYGQSDHHRANAALDLNYRAKHVNGFGNVSVSDNYQITNLAYNRTQGATQFTQRGFDRDGTRGLLYKAGADFFFGTDSGHGPKHTLGVIVAGNASANEFGTNTTANLLGGPGRVDSTLRNQTDNPSWNRRVNAALNYQFVDTVGHELTLDADYTRFGNESPSVINTTYQTATGESLFRRRNRFAANTDITVLTLKADFVNEWKRHALKLSTGLKHTDVQTDNDLLAYTGGTDTPELADRDAGPATRTNRFTYRETINAAYATLNKTWGKWSLQAGLRAEHSTVLGRSTDLTNQTINRPDTSYLNLFPTTYLSYQASEKSQFSFSYGRRIERPNYQDLNPFIYQIDPYTSIRGNPFLRPAYTHKGSLSYTYKWATTLALAYSRTTDFATDIIRQEGLIAYSTVANVGRAEVLNLSLSTPISITKGWTSYLYAGATWNRFRGSLPATTTVAAEAFDQRAFAFEGYMQHSFTLSKRLEMQLSGFWNAPTRQTIFQNGGLGAVNLSATRKVMHERGRLTLSADDLFNTMRWRQSGESTPGTFSNGQQFNLDRKWESRRISLRFSYRFGSNEVKAARDRETGQDAGRIKVKGN